MMLFVYDLGDLKMTTLMFSVIFIIYLIMYYFSKRKVYFSWKIPSLFILLIIGCIGFSNIYSNTKGLNTIYELPKNKDIQEIYFSTDRYIFDEDKPSTVDNQEIENLTTKNITIQNKKNFMKSMYETPSIQTEIILLRMKIWQLYWIFFLNMTSLKTNRLGITSTYFYRRSLYEKNYTYIIYHLHIFSHLDHTF